MAELEPAVSSQFMVITAVIIPQMISIPSSPPVIHALPQEANRPVWSVMIPVYNCARFLPDTLQSVLVQGVPEEQMQIEVVDDASTDCDVEALVNQVGRGRVKYFRQDRNVGSLRNFETCINRSRGHLIHLLHGDDRIRKGYYRKIGNLFRTYPEAGAAFCRYRSINEHGEKVSEKSAEMYREGILPDWLPVIGERQRIQYAAITVRREVYEHLGGFFGVTYGEDWEMWVRIARHYPVAYTPEILAEYRKHTHSITGNKFLKGEHLQDLLCAMLLIQEHLPDEKKADILQRSKKYYASYGIKVANELWHRLHSKKITDAQVRQILKLNRGPIICWEIAKLYFRLITQKL